MTKIAEVMEFMHPDYKVVFDRMIEREKMTVDITVNEVLKYFTPDKIKTNEENVALAALGGAESRYSVTKFSPQLSFTQRCEILGLHRLGYHAEVLAKAYKVDRRTVTHICNSRSTRYKNVREQEKAIGRDFVSKYVTPEIRAHVETFREVQQGNNPAASGMAGIQTVQGKFCEYKHRVVIGWCEPSQHDVEVAGWYYKDLDGDMPEHWFQSGPESMKNSKACYEAMIDQITDKM